MKNTVSDHTQSRFEELKRIEQSRRLTVAEQLELDRIRQEAKFNFMCEEPLWR